MGRLISRRLELALVRWEGVYQQVEGRWLRWETPSGALLPTPQELVCKGKHQAAEAQHQVAAAQQQATEAQRRAAEAQDQAATLGALLARYRELFGGLPPLTGTEATENDR